MISQEKDLLQGKVTVSMNDNEEETETREYEIRVDPREGMLKTIIYVEHQYGTTRSSNSFKLFYKRQDGKLERARTQKSNELLKKQNPTRYFVPISDAEDTDAKVLRDANFNVERIKTSEIQ